MLNTLLTSPGGMMMSGIGAIGSAVGAYQQAKSAKSAMRYQAAMAEINARLSEMSAQQSLQQGQQQVAAYTMKAGQMKGRTRAALAANGVDLGSGSAAELQASNDIIKDIDRNTIEANAIRSAWGYRIQGANASNEALMARSSANSISPMMAGFNSLLGSATKVAPGWYSLNKQTASSGAGAAAIPGGNGFVGDIDLSSMKGWA